MSFPLKRPLQGDPVIWAIFFILCIISLVEVFSAASALSYETGNFMAPFFRQLGFVLLGIVVVWVFHSIPCRFYKIVPIFLWPASIVLLILALVLGGAKNGAARWLFGFQPSEVAKGVLVITAALILSYGQTENGADKRAMKMVLVASVITCGLIFTENFSTAVLLFGTIFVMLFIGRVAMRQMGQLVAVLMAIGCFAVLIVAITPESVLTKIPVLHRAGVWVDRITAQAEGTGDFFTPAGVADTTRLMDYYHEHPQESNANIAIATCNVYGKMPGRSEQRDHLAQAYSDFIYAIIIEEMGVEGGLLVVFLYVVLLFRAGRIASRCERNFPAFLTMGLAILLVMQAMMNVLVAVGIAPVTGQPLPLISRGGSSFLITCSYFGMMLSVSRYARKNLDGKKVELLPAPSADPRAEDFQSSEGLS